jgi:hypothetical protein
MHTSILLHAILSYCSRYRLCYVGSDGTAEVELVFFEKAAKELIGKTALTLIRSKVPAGMSVEDAIQFARTDQTTPRELTSIVSRKYRLVVSVTTRSFEPEAGDPSYQVHRFEMLHANRPRSTTLGRGPGLTLASPSKSADSSGLNAAGDALAAAAILDQPSSSMAALSTTLDSNEPASSMVSIQTSIFLMYQIF